MGSDACVCLSCSDVLSSLLEVSEEGRVLLASAPHPLHAQHAVEIGLLLGTL